jgi:hypothetical protein
VIELIRRVSQIPTLLALAVAVVIVFLGACTNSAPPSVVFHNGNQANAGAGVNPVFNQRVSFAIKIPPVPPAARKAVVWHAGAKRLSAPTPQPTALYIAPLTGSVTITLVAVNGVSLAQPAPGVPPANVPGSCVPAGCTVNVNGVAAANGIDRFAVVTYTGINATGSVISSGVVDVLVPTANTQTVGGGSSTTLTIGGFVASLTLSVTPTTYKQGTASAGSAVVAAKDATGATIIGNAQFANPILLGVSTSAGSTLRFSFPSGTSTFAIIMPLSSPVPLHYDGGASNTTTVTATSVDGNGNVVSASPVPLTVTIIAPSPSPTPTHSPTAPPKSVSMYVLNGMNNAVEEFPSPAPAATPRREFGPKLALFDCSPGTVPYAVGMVQGLAVDAAGNAYVTNNTLCNPSATLVLTVWQFGPSTVGTVPPTSTYVTPSAYTAATSQNLGLDRTSQFVLVPTDNLSGTPSTLRLTFLGASGSLVSVLGDGPCIPLIGFSSCDGVNQYSNQNVYNVVVDSRGYTYWSGFVDLSGNPVILVFAPGATAPLAYSAIDGPSTDTELDPFDIALAIEGTTLYVLNGGSGPGYSNCGPIDSPTTTCADGNTHEYVTAYDTTKLVAGTAVDLKPLFVLGGDAVGRFGSTYSNGLAQAFSNRMAVYKGTLYVANTSGPNCPVSCGSNAVNGIAPAPGEIDLYSVASLSGDHNNVAPTTVIKNGALVPAGVFLGASGATSGPPIPAIRGIPAKYRYHAWRVQQIR